MSSSNSENLQTNSQLFWQNKQFQKSRINYQNKSQKVHFDDYDSQYDENWTSESENLTTYYNDDDYYENKSYDEILKSFIAAKSENVQSFESNKKIEKTHCEDILSEKLIQMTKSLQLTLKCRLCVMKFYSNNKLHKHLRSDQHARKHQKAKRLFES
jgi:hypothetical protein